MFNVHKLAMYISALATALIVLYPVSIDFPMSYNIIKILADNTILHFCLGWTNYSKIVLSRD